MGEKPRLLDAFCGAGGCTRGYQMAGFHVTGVDIAPQPRYVGDAFVQGDAIAYIREHGREYDAIHASPPCQRYTEGNRRYPQRREQHPDLLAPTRHALQGAGRPWAIENVAGAKPHMRQPAVICGASVGLPSIQRHRLFECSFPVLTQPCSCRGNGVDKLGIYGERPDGRKLNSRYGTARAPRTLASGSEAMGIDWMTWKELTQAIPPAYTYLIGAQLRRYLETERSAA